MIRLTVLAALVTAVALPASAQEVRISLAAKSPAQIESEVRQAARSVCLRATATESFRIQALDRCVKATVAETMAKVSTVELAAHTGMQYARR